MIGYGRAMNRYRGRRALAFALAALVSLLTSAAALAFDPATETQNFAKTTERELYVTKTPEFQTRLALQEVQDNVDLAEIQVAEAAVLQSGDQRIFEGNVCFQRKRECAGDVRFYDWAPDFGMREPVLFTGRSGATLSGNVWATAGGPAKRPAVVITTGSVQAPETLYWGIAAALAKHGYVVLTYDVQGQGRSDTFGEGVDLQEGVPSQAGQPFYDGTEDALDFLLSSPSSPFKPRKSCTSGTDHGPRHQRRVDAGLNAAFNPLHGLVDASRIGIAGHSLGAGAVSYVGQIDDRVDAIVAWDNLGTGSSHPACPSGAAPRPDNPPITKPAIGMSNDYGLVATPNQDDPEPEGHNGAFAAFKTAGVDSMQVNKRGGTHYEYSFIPGQTVPALGLATLRGMDMATWYTVAWLDRYVKGDNGAVERLLTDRWRDDTREGEVDAAGDPNLYSFYSLSRFDIRRANGSEAVCDDMRTGCAAMGPDGEPADYSQLADAYRADTAGGGGSGGGGGGGSDGGGGSSGGGAGGDSLGKPCALGQGGGPGRDTLVGTGAGDALRGAEGNDRLRGDAGDDCLYGDAGNDRLVGDSGRDRLKGGAGNDRLKAADGERDKVRCGSGQGDRATVDRKLDRVSRCEQIRKR